MFLKYTFKILTLLPLGAHHLIGALIGRLLYIFNNRNKHISKINIDICFPNLSHLEKQKLLRQTLIENAKTLIESFWLWRHPKQSLTLLLGKIENSFLLERANNQSVGTIFVTPHFGSWEYIGLLTAANSKLLILYAPPKSKYIEQLSCQGRKSTGGSVISTDKLNIKTLIKHIKAGGSVGILPDQVPDGNGGIYVNFFGRKSYTSTLVCKLANKLQCSVVFCYALRNNNNHLKYDAYYHEANKDIYSDDLIKATSALNSHIESFISTAPSQYIWGYKRFKRPAPGDNYPY